MYDTLRLRLGLLGKVGELATGQAVSTDERMPLVPSEMPKSIEDALSAVQQSSTSLGMAIGPVFGGFLLERLPMVVVPGCTKSECESGFSWTTTVFALLFVLLAAAVSALPNRNKAQIEATTSPVMGAGSYPSSSEGPEAQLANPQPA